MTNKSLSPKQPIVITTPTYDVSGLWISKFGDKFIVNYPDESRIKKAWAEFGQILGHSKALKIQYETAGLKESSKKLDEEIKRRTEELEKRTIEIIGYPKIPEYFIFALKSEASKISKYLNQYAIDKYPHLPPSVCVDAMQKAKPFFDTFEVWAIEDKPITTSQESQSVKAERAFKDPVIVGCKTMDQNSYGKNYDRYFIASWGDDIPLTHVLETGEAIE